MMLLSVASLVVHIQPTNDDNETFLQIKFYFNGFKHAVYLTKHVMVFIPTVSPSPNYRSLDYHKLEFGLNHGYHACLLVSQTSAFACLG